VYLLTIDPARSGPLYTEAIACTERSGDHLINSMVHNNAGVTALIAGDLPAARAHLEAAAQAGKQIGLPDTVVMANLSRVQRAEGDLDGARSTLEAALRIGRRNGDNMGMAFAILGLACLAGDACDWDRAAVLHGAAQALRDRTAVRGTSPPRATARTAWTKPVRTWAMSSWVGPTPRAGRSALRRPSTWLSERRARPDRYRR
jgi:MalT-like TPR region